MKTEPVLCPGHILSYRNQNLGRKKLKDPEPALFSYIRSIAQKGNPVKTRLIIDEDSVYEIDEECELQKREAQKQAENKWKNQGRTMKKQDKKILRSG